MRKFIYDLRQGIRNLIHFFPIIWKFRPWDYQYNLDLLGKSLELTYQEMKDGVAENDQAVAEIDEVINRIYIMENNDYWLKYPGEVASKMEEDNWNRLMQLLKEGMQGWWN